MKLATWLSGVAGILLAVGPALHAERHENSQLGFSIDLPPGMNQMIGPGTGFSDIAEVYVVDMKDQASIRISKQPIKASLEQQKDLIIQTRGAKLKNVEKTTVDGAKAYRFLSDIATNVKSAEIVAEHGSDSYLLAYSALPSAFDKHLPVFNTIVSNFRWMSKGAPNRSDNPAAKPALGRWSPFESKDIGVRTLVSSSWGAPAIAKGENATTASFTLGQSPNTTISFVRMECSERKQRKGAKESLGGPQTSQRSRKVAGKDAEETIMESPMIYWNSVSIPDGKRCVVASLAIRGPRQEGAVQDFDKVLANLEIVK